MKHAVIIKHKDRHWDYRVDMVDVPEGLSKEEIAEACRLEMIGPFEVIAVTDKINFDRDITKGLNEIKEIDLHHFDIGS